MSIFSWKPPVVSARCSVFHTCFSQPCGHCSIKWIVYQLYHFSDCLFVLGESGIKKLLSHLGIKSYRIIFRRIMGNARVHPVGKGRTRLLTWHKKFSGEREVAENLSHGRRPRTSFTVENIEAIRKLIEKNRNHWGSQHELWKCWQWQITWNFKVSAGWMPRLPSEDHKRHRFEFSQRLFRRF